MKKIALICFLISTRIFSFAQSEKYLMPYREVNKWGYCDTSCKIIFSPVWDSVGFFEESKYAVVKINKKVGAINNLGKVIVEPLYNFLQIDKEIFIISNNGKKWGAVNNKGNVIVPIKYDHVFSFGSNIEVIENKKEGMYNSAGKLIIPVVYDHITIYSVRNEINSGGFLLGVKGKNKYKVNQLTGKSVLLSSKDESLLIPTLLEDEPFWGGVKPNQDEIYNLHREKIKQEFSPDAFRSIEGIGGYWAYAIEKNGKYAAVVFFTQNAKPELLTQYEYDRIYFLFPDDLGRSISGGSRFIIIGKKNNGTGIANEFGRELLPFIYNKVEKDQSYFLLWKKSKLGVFFYRKQASIIEPQYDFIEFVKDLYSNDAKGYPQVFSVLKVTVNGKVGYVGQNGVEYFKE